MSGSDAAMGQFPWHVLISMDGYGICNGALIDPGWVLTLGQCVEGFTNFTVTFGLYDFLEQEENETQTQELTSAEFLHPGYSRFTLIHDLALIKLDMPVNLTEGLVGIIRLMHPEEVDIDLTGSPAWLSGWGKLAEDDFQPFVLQWSNVSIMENGDCSVAFGTGNIYNTQMCTSGEDDTGYCGGDEGAPLTVLISDVPVLVGLASFTSAAGCDRQAPTVYTRTSEYLQWISDTMNGIETTSATPTSGTPTTTRPTTEQPTMETTSADCTCSGESVRAMAALVAAAMVFGVLARW